MEDSTLAKPISKKKSKKVEALNSQELKILNMVLDGKEKSHKYRNIVKLQLETGMRIGEVLAHSIFNVNTKTNTLLINNTLTLDDEERTVLGEHTKCYNRLTGIDTGIRNFTMNQTIREIVAEQKQTEISNIYGLLFWNYEKNTFINYADVNSWLSEINEKYKITSINLTTHVLRHTKITEMRKAGMDMKVIQYLVRTCAGKQYYR